MDLHLKHSQQQNHGNHLQKDSSSGAGGEGGGCLCVFYADIWTNHQKVSLIRPKNLQIDISGFVGGLAAAVYHILLKMFGSTMQFQSNLLPYCWFNWNVTRLRELQQDLSTLSSPRCMGFFTALMCILSLQQAWFSSWHSKGWTKAQS